MRPFFCLFSTLIFTALFLLNGRAEAVTLPNLAGDMNLLQRTSNAFVEIAKQSKPAVVNIRVEKYGKRSSTVTREMEELLKNPLFEQFFGPYYRQYQNAPRKYIQHGQGSGFIISPEGLILTNNHVVDNADIIRVTLADRREFTAERVGADPQTDVALLKINNPAAAPELPVLPLGDSSTLEAGEWVIAIGNPFGLNQTVTTGSVSATGRNSIGLTQYENFIQTDAAINPGNSGGPLLNTNGEVVGINTALFSSNGGAMGIGFAIPINAARTIKQQLQQFGHVTRGWLGTVVQELNPDLAATFNLQSTAGVLVSQVDPSSPAAIAGIHPGDVIKKLDNIPVNTISDLRNSVGMLSPGTRILIAVARDREEKLIPVTIGERGVNPGQALPQISVGPRSNFTSLGLSLQELSDNTSLQHGYQPGSGLLITNVVPGSPAARAGIEPGQLVEEINRRKVKKLSDLDDLSSDAESQKKLLLRVRNGEFSTFIVLTAP